MQVDHVKASNGKGGSGQPAVAAARGFGDAVDWCSEVTGLLAALSGVSVLRIEEDELVVGLTTYAIPSSEDASGD